MGRFCLYFIFFIVFLLASCQSEIAPIAGKRSFDLSKSDEAINLQQYNSLKNIYFADNQSPLNPTVSEIQRVDNLLATSTKEMQRLGELYRGNKLLIALAIRDSDNDGVQDYRISDEEEGYKFLGRFYEGDNDVDGDGILNSFDSEPYLSDQSFLDANKNGIPEKLGKDHLPGHLLLDESKYTSEQIELQKTIFEETGIVLIEKSFPFSGETLEVIGQVLLKVYKPWFVGPNRLKTIRIISSDDYALLNANIDDQTQGVYYSHSRQLSLFKEGQNQDKLAVFSLVVHEIAHAFHFAMDDYGDTLESLSPFLPRPKFDKLAEDFGWAFRLTGYDYEWGVYRDHWQGGVLEYEDLRYLEVGLNDWDEMIEESLVSNTYRQELAENFVIGSYALSHPYEFYADAMTAFVLLALEKSYDGDLDKIEQLRSSITEAYPDFRYWFLLGGYSLEEVWSMTPDERQRFVKVFDHFVKVLPIDAELLTEVKFQ